MYWKKMGTFSNLVKRYVKPVDPPVSDRDKSIFGGEFTLFTF